MDYNEQVLQVKERYGPRITALLERYRDRLESGGYSCSPISTDANVDEYRWCFEVVVDRKRSQQDDSIDVGIDFFIAESLCREGSEEGINFFLLVQGYGGYPLGGIAPYNYTPQVWVAADDAEAVEVRFLEVADEGTVWMLNLITEWHNRQGVQV